MPKSGRVAHFAADSDETRRCTNSREEVDLVYSAFGNNLERHTAIHPKPGDPHTNRAGRRETTKHDGPPESSNQPYDIRDIIHPVVDDGYFFEVQEHFAANIVIGFARLGGYSVGIVANQPAFLAGVLDIDASVKAARFVRFCDLLQYSADHV
jgi:propionyl-CoA carboxylase beta chain